MKYRKHNTGIHSPWVWVSTNYIAPKVYKDLQGRPATVMPIGNGSRPYAYALCDFLAGRQIDVTYLHLRNVADPIRADQVEGRVVLPWDDNIGDGKTYAKFMERKPELMNLGALDVKFGAPIDLRNQADYSCTDLFTKAVSNTFLDLLSLPQEYLTEFMAAHKRGDIVLGIGENELKMLKAEKLQEPTAENFYVGKLRKTWNDAKTRKISNRIVDQTAELMKKVYML